MKKTLAGLFTAALLIAGLETVATAPSAQASIATVASVGKAPSRAATCYPGSIATTAKVVGPQIVHKGQRAVFKVNVKATSSSARPTTGKIRLRVRRNGAIFRERFRSYSGKTVNIVFPGPAVLGDYNVFVVYIPRRCSVYNQSPLAETSFTVVK